MVREPGHVLGAGLMDLLFDVIIYICVDIVLGK